jgi:hydrogenase maturation protein HypF
VYAVRGTVQGVGFRPAVCRAAVAAGLGGGVRNAPGSVELTLTGPAAAVTRFVRDLPRLAPPQAVVREVTLLREAAAASARPFAIASSASRGARQVVVPSDLAVCAACRAEILDPSGRRHRYAFTTCTDCGPRYTLLTGMPYDRRRTTMARFRLCAACAAEYRDPADRRFHAETIACPRCGPRLRLCRAGGRPVPGDPLAETRRMLAAGAVVAVRGIGGFLLAADPFNRTAVARLRRDKARPGKPFALLALDLATARRFARVSPAEAAWLSSAAAPIAILDARAGTRPALPLDLLAPDTATLGIMLPSAPLHVLLAAPLPGLPEPAPAPLLLMTSGNRHDEPICLDNAEALERLAGLADAFLLHDRPIAHRCDDSVGAVRGGRPQVWRRARGFAPQPLRLAERLRACTLAAGTHHRNTIALAGGQEAVVSPHVGDLETPAACAGWEDQVASLTRFLGRRPQRVAVDLHPDYAATRLGRAWARERGLPVTAVQHHLAHGVACLAEHGLEEGLALVFDGAGLGDDGAIWGAECFEIRRDACTRRATFAPAMLPGGDAAVRCPARQLVGRWCGAGIEPPPRRLAELGVSPEAAAVWARMCRGSLHAPRSHAAGRLFDAVAVLLGAAPAEVSYDGQAAIRLETLARRATQPGGRDLPFATREEAGRLLVDWSPAIARLTERRPRGAADAAAWALAFHHSVARAAVEMIRYAAGRCALRDVALSGGTFMNGILLARLERELVRRGFRPKVHAALPPNDGCVSAGQAVWAGRMPLAQGAERR